MIGRGRGGGVSCYVLEHFAFKNSGPKVQLSRGGTPPLLPLKYPAHFKIETTSTSSNGRNTGYGNLHFYAVLTS